MFQVTTYPSTLALTLDEAKAHLNILDTSFDTLITNYIKSAQLMLWKEGNVWAAPATLTGYCQQWREIYIYEYPFNSVVVTYTDENEEEQTLDAANYKLFDKNFPVVFCPTESPDLTNNVNPIKLVIEVGYAIAPDNVKQCLRMIVGDLFETRQTNAFGSTSQLSRATDYQISLISRRISSI